MGGGAAESGVEAREMEEGAVDGWIEEEEGDGGCMRKVEGRWCRSSQGLTRESNSWEKGGREPGSEMVAK